MTTRALYGELVLEHAFSGVELDKKYARDTLANMYRLWMRPVHIETNIEGATCLLSFDGSEHKLTKPKSEEKKDKEKEEKKKQTP